MQKIDGVPMSHNKKPGGGALRAKSFAKIALSVSLVSLLTGFIVNGFRPSHADQTVQFQAAVGTGDLSMTVDNSGPCTNFDTSNLTLGVDTLAGGTVSGCLTTTASTTGINGYTIVIDGPDDGSLRLSNQTIGAKDGSLNNPTVFTAQTTGGVWGFAIPNEQIKGFNTFGFNTLLTDYTNWAGFIGSGSSYIANQDPGVGKYAPVPTTATPFSQTTAPNVSADAYNVFFAVSTSEGIATGTYTGVITLSMLGNSSPMLACSNAATGFATGCTDSNITVDLPNGLVPVKYTGTVSAPQWTVVSANDPTWYNYAGKEWANAVTFQTPANRNLAPGTILSAGQISDILGYWVYVPRYEYKLINTGFDGASNCSPSNLQFCPQAFDIRFVSKNAPVQNGTTVGSWRTSPGFQTIDGPMSGLWVAKFEASANGGATACANATICNVATLTPTFIPSSVGGDATNPATAGIVPSWSYITVGNIFANVQRVAAIHGITINNGMVNNVNNASWGSIAYLSQSLYGICDNRYCSKSGSQITTESNGASTNADAMRVLNNGVYITTEPRARAGCGPATATGAPSAVDATTTTCNLWNTAIGQTASTTQNPTGIYDLAGGLWEYTFSNRSQADNVSLTYASSGLTDATAGWSYARYGDVLYRNSDFQCSASPANPACDWANWGAVNGGLGANSGDWGPIKYGSFAGNARYFGTALAETVAQNSSTASYSGGWGGDYSGSPSATGPWFVRGGEAANGAYAGVFAFHRYSGVAYQAIGWRAVLSGV